MHRIQCKEYNAKNTMHRIQNNSYNAIHVIQCIYYNVYNIQIAIAARRNLAIFFLLFLIQTMKNEKSLSW